MQLDFGLPTYEAILEHPPCLIERSILSGSQAPERRVDMFGGHNAIELLRVDAVLDLIPAVSCHSVSPVVGNDAFGPQRECSRRALPDHTAQQAQPSAPQNVLRSLTGSELDQARA